MNPGESLKESIVSSVYDSVKWSFYSSNLATNRDRGHFVCDAIEHVLCTHSSMRWEILNESG